MERRRAIGCKRSELSVLLASGRTHRGDIESPATPEIDDLRDIPAIETSTEHYSTPAVGRDTWRAVRRTAGPGLSETGRQRPRYRDISCMRHEYLEVRTIETNGAQRAAGWV